MNPTEAMLALYRAARDFTRRVAGIDGLERAALAYATSLGWAPRSSTEREANLRARVEILELSIGRVVDANEGTAGEWTTQRAIRVDRAIAELRDLVIR